MLYLCLSTDGHMVVTSPVQPLFLILPYLIKAADVNSQLILLSVAEFHTATLKQVQNVFDHRL